jgi:uncharacterized protein HemY
MTLLSLTTAHLPSTLEVYGWLLATGYTAYWTGKLATRKRKGDGTGWLIALTVLVLLVIIGILELGLVGLLTLGALVWLFFYLRKRKTSNLKHQTSN